MEGIQKLVRLLSTCTQLVDFILPNDKHLRSASRSILICGRWLNLDQGSKGDSDTVVVVYRLSTARQLLSVTIEYLVGIVHRRNQECANRVSQRLLSEDGNWPESVESHCFWRWATRSFESGTRSGHVAVRSPERNQPESPVFWAEVDSGCDCVAVMQSTESRQRNHFASDRGCRGRNSTAGSVFAESEVSPIFVIVANVIFHQPPQMPLIQNNHVVQ